jgi:glutaredoxin/glutathione-dependent peroxiredoxin
MQAGHTVKMVSDPDLALAKLLNQEVDLSAAGLGKRSHRFAMLVEDGEIKKFVREEKPGEVKVTDAESVLKMIGGEKK